MADTLWLIGMLATGVALLVVASRMSPGARPSRPGRVRTGGTLHPGSPFVGEVLDLHHQQWQPATFRLLDGEVVCVRSARRSKGSPGAVVSRGESFRVVGRHAGTDTARSCFRLSGDVVLAVPAGSGADAALGSLPGN